MWRWVIQVVDGHRPVAAVNFLDGVDGEIAQAIEQVPAQGCFFKDYRTPIIEQVPRGVLGDLPGSHKEHVYDAGLALAECEVKCGGICTGSNLQHSLNLAVLQEINDILGLCGHKRVRLRYVFGVEIDQGRRDWIKAGPGPREKSVR